VHEFFLPLPLDAPPTYKRVRGASITRRNFTTSGKFVAVKEYTYIKVAKCIGETQVGINLFYLVDNNTIIGYRKDDHYFLREGAKKNVTKIQARKKKKPSLAAKH
jgi:hypothetical protein